jgi:hypothetical protein
VKLSRKVQQHVPDLARQMKRSEASVPLNISRSPPSIPPPESVVDDLERIDHIVATWWNMAH